MFRSGRQIVFAVMMAAGFASGAGAQEYCVSCSEPSAMYRCVIENPRPGLSSSLQVHCLTALAKEGGHAQCVVRRGVTVFECDAPVKKVAIPADGAVPATEPQTVAKPAEPQQPSEPSEPRTLAEMAQRAKEASDRQWKEAGQNMKNAGQATGDFFKKTFTCIGSLFTKCTQ
jgi:hypothetical protein